jgi:hypothetical protein
MWGIVGISKSPARTDAMVLRQRLIRVAMLMALAMVWLARLTVAQDVTTTGGELAPGAPRPGPQPEITVISRIGFDPDLSMVKRGCWARISVLMSNDLKPVEGFLRIRKRERETLIYQQRIDLPLHSRKLWTGYILADDDPNELLVEYYTTRWRLLASEPVTYIPRPPEDDLVLGIVPALQRSGLRRLVNISSRDSGSAVGLDAQRRGGRSARYLLFTDKSLLPREANGYESISAFLWDGGDLTELEPETSLALKGWVYQGGTLIVAGGENNEWVKQSFLNEILPVEILSAGPADLMESFRQTFGSAPATSGPTLISFVRAVRGRTLMGTPERPLIVEGTYGAGRVVFVAFSLTSWALQRWDGRDALVNKMFKPTRSRLLATMTAESRRAMDTRLKSNLLAELPTPVFIIAFLGLYIVLVVPVNYFVFRAWKRVEYAWFALPVVALAFGFLAYNIGYFSQSRTLDADEISLVEGMAGCPLANAKTFYAIYSPTGTNEPIRFPDRPVFARPLLAVGFAGPGFASRGGDPMGASRNPLIVTYGNGFEVFDFVINTWAARSLECDYVTDLGGQIDAQLTLDGAALKGTVTNHLGYPLNEVKVILPSGRTRDLGNVPNGQVARLESSDFGRSGPGGAPGATRYPQPSITPITPGQPSMAQGRLQEEMDLQRWMQSALSSQVRRRPSGRGSEPVPFIPFFQSPVGGTMGSWFGSDYARVVPNNACLLLGWAPRSTLKPAVGQGRSKRTLNPRSQTLIHMIVLPFEAPTERLTAVSETFWSVEQAVGAAERVLRGQDYSLDDYVRSVRGGSGIFRLAAGQNIFALRPTIELGGRTLDSLTIAFTAEKKFLSRYGSDSIQALPANGLAVSLYDFASGTWESFGSVKTIECKKGAGRFFDQSGQEIRMKIEVTDPEIQADSSGKARTDIKNGFLRDVRVNATLR